MNLPGSDVTRHKTCSRVRPNTPLTHDLRRIARPSHEIPSITPQRPFCCHFPSKPTGDDQRMGTCAWLSGCSSSGHVPYSPFFAIPHPVGHASLPTRAPAQPRPQPKLDIRKFENHQKSNSGQFSGLPHHVRSHTKH